jgi:hypothetical protein
LSVAFGFVLSTCITVDVFTLTADAVAAKEAEVANEAVVAVPANDPVNPPVEIVEPLTIRPRRAINSFAMIYSK